MLARKGPAGTCRTTSSAAAVVKRKNTPNRRRARSPLHPPYNAVTARGLIVYFRLVFSVRRLPVPDEGQDNNHVLSSKSTPLTGYGMVHRTTRRKQNKKKSQRLLSLGGHVNFRIFVRFNSFSEYSTRPDSSLQNADLI